MTACNPWRGDVAAEMDGRQRVLRLTLGALAELEAAGGAAALAARLDSGSARAADVIAVIGAGLRGAGAPESNADVGRMSLTGGGPEAVALAWTLLAAAASGAELTPAPTEPASEPAFIDRVDSDPPEDAPDQGAAFDWPALTALGLGVLRLTPDVFWAMTPQEFAAVLRGTFGPPQPVAAPMTNDHLTALMRAYPDIGFL